MPTTTSPLVSRPLAVSLKMLPGGMHRFLPLLGEGFVVHGRAGLSVEAFLCGEIGIPANYLRDRVQTVFLNGKAIDDLGSTVVVDNSVMALSAAMPGLAGAVLRRGGFYAAMRRQISHETAADARTGKAAAVTLKLFNLVARELGPNFLEKGILIPCGRLREFLDRQGRWEHAGCVAAEVDGMEMDPRGLPEMIPRRGQAFLTIKKLDP